MTRHRAIPALLNGAGVLALFLLAGCQSKEEKALDKAKAQAISSNIPQQVQYINSKGYTVTRTVEPPLAKGQQPAVTTLIMPPPPGTTPHSTNPVITPLPSAAQGGYPPQGYYGPGGPPGAGQGGYPPYGAGGQPPSGQGSGSPYGPGAPPPSGQGGYPAYGAGSPPPSGQGGYPASGPAGQPSYGSAPNASFSIPPGTEFVIRIDQRLGSRISYAGERFYGNLYEPVLYNGAVIIPAGAPIAGRVVEAHQGGHFRGRSILDLRVTAMKLNGYEYPLPMRDDVITIRGKGRRSTAIIGGMTGAGMLIGGLGAGGVGMAIGAAAGAGSGAAIAGTTDNHTIDIPSESILHFRLSGPLSLGTP